MPWRRHLRESLLEWKEGQRRDARREADVGVLEEGRADRAAVPRRERSGAALRGASEQLFVLLRTWKLANHGVDVESGKKLITIKAEFSSKAFAVPNWTDKKKNRLMRSNFLSRQTFFLY